MKLVIDASCVQPTVNNEQLSQALREFVERVLRHETHQRRTAIEKE